MKRPSGRRRARPLPAGSLSPSAGLARVVIGPRPSLASSTSWSCPLVMAGVLVASEGTDHAVEGRRERGIFSLGCDEQHVDDVVVRELAREHGHALVDPRVGRAAARVEP